MPQDPTASPAWAARMVVAAAATDAWVSAKRDVARLLGRGDPRQRLLTELQLDQARDQLQRAAGQERERARAELEALCRTRLADLLKEKPDVAGELREVVGRIQAELPAGTVTAQEKALRHEQWREALRPLPEILDWYRDNLFAGTLLAAGFIVIKCYVIARGDLATALGILQYTGVAAVVAASLLSSLPILTAVALAYSLFHTTQALGNPVRPWRQLAWVTAGALALAAVFTPWPYLVLAAIFGPAIAGIRALGMPTLVSRLIYLLLAVVTAALVILSLYAVWLPHEIVTFQPHGRKVVAPEVGYVLSEANGWITILTTEPEPKHKIVRFRDAAVKTQVVCERRPTPGHFIAHLADATTLWRLVTSNFFRSLNASANRTCPGKMPYLGMTGRSAQQSRSVPGGPDQPTGPLLTASGLAAIRHGQAKTNVSAPTARRTCSWV